MSLRSWFGSRTPAPPEESVKANPDWQTYRAGEGDRAGRKIKKVYAVGDGYVIYFIGSELYYETSPALAKDLGPADSALARINRLLDPNPPEGTREYLINVSTLELAADAFEMFFCGERSEAIEILNNIREKLQVKEEGQRRLAYEAGAVLITAAAWGLYMVVRGNGWMCGQQPSNPFYPWNPWALAPALALLGGLFSVCLNLGSVEVNVNQEWWFLGIAGVTRSFIAFLAGIGLLLAMRSKIFAGIAYSEGKAPDVSAPLLIAEMFFCFLAGFSESLVPNILSKSADQKSTDAKAPADKTPADQAAAEKAAAEKAAADKAAAEKDAADKAAAEKDAAGKAAAGAAHDQPVQEK